MAKQKTIYCCSACGNETANWAGKCPACGAWNTLEEVKLGADSRRKSTSSFKSARNGSPIKRISELDTSAEIRIVTGRTDFDRVLSLDLLENAARKKAEQKQTAPASGGFQIVSESGETDAQVEALLQARYDAKKAKDFTVADRIRDDLKAMGVEITDIPGGVRWKR